MLPLRRVESGSRSQPEKEEGLNLSRYGIGKRDIDRVENFCGGKMIAQARLWPPERARMPPPVPRSTRSPKSLQSHARSLALRINDGRHLRILLDQGFGAWRAEGPARHDFHAPTQKQAAEIKRTDFRLRIGEQHGTRVILEFV
jgi:hypothetical protein